MVCTKRLSKNNMFLVNGIPSLFFFACFLFLFHVNSSSADKSRSTYIVHMDISLMPKVFSNYQQWYSSTIDAVKSKNLRSSPTILYAYNNAFNGFSALLGKDELEVLKTSQGFVSAYIDMQVIVDTTHTTDFLSLNPVIGLWPTSSYGKDVIVGVIDSGVWPESVSYKDDGMTGIPSKWKGQCEVGQEFNASMCNLKLIGARYFNKGLIAANPNITISMNSARDTDGHGTHTSSTVGGNYVEGVNFFGYASGTAKGIAPRARLAMYKVLWDEGRYASDVLAGMDQAISDGVDIISVSMGFDSVQLYQDPIAIASFGAMKKGVLVSASAGNSGSHLGNLHNGIPWVLTVAAGSIDRWFGGSLTLGNGLSFFGSTMFPARAYISKLPLIYNKTISACNSSGLLAKAPDGIIICDDIGSVSEQASYLSSTKIPGAVFISDDPQLFETYSFNYLGVIINSKDAMVVIEYAKNTSGIEPIATIEFQHTIVGTKPAPRVAAYSSRGPSISFPGILKPDLMAPGSAVLAAWIPNDWTSTISESIKLSSDYNILSGTSMSCPHASGIGALLKAAHPEWTPAAIRSAMITTADPIDNTLDYIRDYGTDLEIASPLAMGAGHVDPNRALDPGLIYDATYQDYVNLLCSMNFTVKQITTITGSSYKCANISADLNYPSFIALYSNSTEGMLAQTFQRTITNVGDGAVTYKAKVTAPPGSVVIVSPDTIVFGQKFEKQSYTLTLRYMSDRNKKVTFGSIVWVEENGNRTVRSPIAVSPLLTIR